MSSICHHDGCGNVAEAGKDECFRHRVAGVGFSFRGGVRHGRKNWNTTAREWKTEHLGTADDRELAKRGIERADST